MGGARRFSMGGLSIWHWLVFGVIVLLLFGKGRFSDMMGDVAKGIKRFKKGMAEDDASPPARRHIEGQRTPEAAPSPTPTAEAERHRPTTVPGGTAEGGSTALSPTCCSSSSGP